MRRVVGSSILAIVLAFSAATLSGDSRPVLTGFAQGLELCAQSGCGFALFAGLFQGEVNSRPANGGFVAAVTHEADLPEFMHVAQITGGQFIITAGRRTFRGDVIGGEIMSINPASTKFCVTMTLDITDGGNGQVYFRGLLDHGPFPPTIAGFVTQSPIGCLD